MAKDKSKSGAAGVDPDYATAQGMTLEEAQAEEARLNAADKPAKAPKAPRFRKDGTPFAIRGESLKWTPRMDESLVLAVRDNPDDTGQSLAEKLWAAETFAEEIGDKLEMVTGEKVRARVAYLRRAGVPLARLGRSTVKPDVAHLSSLLGAVATPEGTAG